MTSSTGTTGTAQNNNNDMTEFLSAGAAAVGAGLAFRAAPSVATGTAFAGTLGPLYLASQKPGVRAGLGNAYDRVGNAMGNIDNERMNNDFWHPGRTGI